MAYHNYRLGCVTNIAKIPPDVIVNEKGVKTNEILAFLRIDKESLYYEGHKSMYISVFRVLQSWFFHSIKIWRENKNVSTWSSNFKTNPFACKRCVTVEYKRLSFKFFFRFLFAWSRVLFPLVLSLIWWSPSTFLWWICLLFGRNRWVGEWRGDKTKSQESLVMRIDRSHEFCWIYPCANLKSDSGF